ncbi:MAG: SusD/RagB family nutrient-binding outer membrane lipoprotein, partial [Gammaproteobacteria bacterium]|nr:SusD/RagB family nutrient-binding outer membrane lipoprotein [Gammaproteobacteria bacterium]NIY11789.1 SusD/RagB family nutrient-binding outer membrane lipoprotein [Gemmatimonadota bacterium]
LQGDAEDPIIRPVYDSQESIYQALVADLETALGLFDPSATSWGSEDLIYGGDIGLWMKFANSLKLRMAMRISDVAPSQAQTWAEEAASHPAGLITDNSESASLVFLSGSPNQ